MYIIEIIELLSKEIKDWIKNEDNDKQIKEEIFKHSKELGDCPAYKLFDSVEVKRKDDVEYPRKYQDYEVYINRENIPDSVEVKQMI